MCWDSSGGDDLGQPLGVKIHGLVSPNQPTSYNLGGAFDTDRTPLLSFDSICENRGGDMRAQPVHRQNGKMPLTISDEIEIADWEISENFVRSSGPGGQNVNKVSTAVELRFEAERSPNLPAPVKTRLRKLAGRRWTKEGAIVLQVEETRSQARNREIARERLAELIRAALVKPKRRIATKPTYGSQKRRLKAKKVRGDVKAMRGKVQGED